MVNIMKWYSTTPFLVFLLHSTSKTCTYGMPFFSNKASASKLGGSGTDFHKSSLQAEKYSSLPHTIFAPDGRLYNIETNARSVSNANDLSSSLVVAIKFGTGADEAVIVISTSHMSPHLPSQIQPEALENNSDTSRSAAASVDGSKSDEGESSKNEKDEESNNRSGNSSHRLWSHAHLHSSYGDGTDNNKSLTVNMPLSILPSNIIIGTGGTAADSIAFHKKIQKISLGLYNENDNFRSTHRIQGTVLSSMLAKKVSSSLQIPTQSSVSSRMYASTAILVGPDVFLGSGSGNNVGIRQSIWRCDPTGQFFSCHMAAVGRGAGTAEAIVMSSIAKAKEGVEKGISEEMHSMELEDLASKISSKDVDKYLSMLSFDDAVLLASKCISRALNLPSTKKAEGIFHQLGIQGILIRSKGKACQTEIIHQNILLNALGRNI